MFTLLDFARTTMWFVPSPDPLLRELTEAATGGVGAGEPDDALPTDYPRQWTASGPGRGPIAL